MTAALRALAERLSAFVARWPSCAALSVVWLLVVSMLVLRGGPLLP